MGTLDFRIAEFWEPGEVDQELRRVYDICSGCRRCLPFCPSFKVLFDRLDVDAVDGDVEKLPAAAAARPRAVALFATCQVEYHDPAVGRATVRVLEKNGIVVVLPAQRCCGMPYLDGGAVEEARALIRDNVRSLAAAARQGLDIVAPGPTCSYMLKREYPWLDGSEEAKLVAGKTLDLFEYLARLKADGALNTDFPRPPGKVAYQVPCHLRAQNIGTKSADVLAAIPGAEVDVIERCSAVDGTWGFKKEYYELSLSVARPLFDAVRTTGAPTVATDCPLAALQIAQGTGATPRHPVQILASAYGIDDAP